MGCISNFLRGQHVKLHVFSRRKSPTLTRIIPFPLLFLLTLNRVLIRPARSPLYPAPWPLAATIADATAVSMYKPPFMPIPPGKSLAGKTVLVTGGNSGLGLEFARQALTLNASHVIVTVRSQAKGDAAIATLRANQEVQATNPDARLEYFLLDLDDYKSGLELVQKVYAEVPELDIILCNAGTNFFNYETSKSGHERLMQVICYTHFLIVLSLFPLMQRTAAKRGSPTRVTFLSSYSHVRHTLETNPIAADESVIAHYDNIKKYVSGKRYQDGKLVINAFVQHLATIVPSSEVIVNCVCPGIVATDINQNLPLWIKPFMCVFFKIKARPVTEGGRVLVRAAVVVGEESHGKYLQTGEIHRGAEFLAQPAGKHFIKKFWAEIVADIGKVNPEVKVRLERQINQKGLKGQPLARTVVSAG